MCLVLLFTAPLQARAQIPGTTPFPDPNATTTTPDRTREPAVEMSFEEVYQLLLSRGLTEEAATDLLRDYDPDRTFSARDVNDILRRVRPEDLSTRRKEKGAETETPAAVPQQLGVSREPVPFGYEVFKSAPDTFEPDQDLAVGNDYRLGPGDELRISVWGSVQQEFFAVVDREGNVTIPEAGMLPAAGMTLGAFEEHLHDELKKIFSGFKMDVSLRRLRRIQVIVAGDVTRPGAYFLSPVSTTFNALYFAGGPTPQGSLRRVRVVRDGKIAAEVDLYPYLMGGDTSGDVRLLSGDTVFITHKGPVATIRGDVNRPAIFELLGGETVADLVRMAAGFTATVYPERATLDRVSPATGPLSVELNLASLLTPDSLRTPGGDPADLPLQDGDNLTIYSIYHVEPRQFVEIQGMVQYPGIYPLFPETRVSDLIFRAGGLLDSAYPLRAELSRLAWSEEGGVPPVLADSVSHVVYIDLAAALGDSDSAQNMRLAKGDKIYIRKIPGWKFQETVKVAGEVTYPGIYPLLVREERLSHVVKRAGGTTDESFLMGASLFRKDLGRVIINFERALEKPGDREDVVMMDGDSIYVPPYPPTILVQGQVSQPGALIYKPGKTANYYLERTGGATDDADKGNTRIIRVDGVVQKAFRRWRKDPKVEPGSRIMVAEKKRGNGVNWGSAIKDGSTIIASLATTIFVLNQLKN